MRTVDYCFTMHTKSLPSAKSFDDHEVRVDCQVYFTAVRGPEGLMFEIHSFSVNEITNMEVEGGEDVTHVIGTLGGKLLYNDIKDHIEMNRDYLVDKFAGEDFFPII